MKYRKIKAFTLAEVMVLLLTLSILLAAFAPVFTRRYNNATTDDVWVFVANDEGEDAYYDSTNKSNTAQAFVGLTPVDNNSVSEMSGSGSEIYYSKLVVGASHNVRIVGRPSRVAQNQMQFRYSDCANNTAACRKGSIVGSLFAGNNNMLVGGMFKNISGDNPQYNSSYGIGTMDALSTGVHNTAVGYKALNKLSTGSNNTAVGYYAGRKIDTTSANTLIGNNSYETIARGEYNTAIGYSAMAGTDNGAAPKRNTAVGYMAMLPIGSALDNTAVGSRALQALMTGKGNTAVGYGSMPKLTTGNYNTAIGYNSCEMVKDGSYKTCIGYNSGSTLPNPLGLASSTLSPAEELFKNDYERVFIGTIPQERIADILSSFISTSVDSGVGIDATPAAVLEVHNINDKGHGLPITNAGDASVVINGSLVVRGNSYFETILQRQHSSWDTYHKDVITDSTNNADQYIPKGLVQQVLMSPTYTGVTVHPLFGYPTAASRYKLFTGFDGYQRTKASVETCKGKCRGHAFNDVRENCICTAVGSYQDPTTEYNTTSSRVGVSTSYDWSSKADKENNVYSCNHDTHDYHTDTNTNNLSRYYDGSAKKYIYQEYRPGKGGRDDGQWYPHKGSDRSYAHGKEDPYLNTDSCCPVLTSDKRLKNIGEKFTAGLEEIKKLNVYNYTFKADPDKIPQVGVIAQDLKLIFPNAVTKDDKGFYQIRLDEMLYAAINAIKTLNTKVTNLAAKVAKDKLRIATLKKDNKELNARLDKLVEEISLLEAKKQK